MPKKVEYWTCDLCGMDHTTEEDAIACEASHMRVAESSYEYDRTGTMKYPEYIVVTFADGRKTRYCAD